MTKTVGRWWFIDSRVVLLHGHGCWWKFSWIFTAQPRLSMTEQQCNQSYTCQLVAYIQAGAIRHLALKVGDIQVWCSRKVVVATTMYFKQFNPPIHISFRMSPKPNVCSIHEVPPCLWFSTQSLHVGTSTLRHCCSEVIFYLDVFFCWAAFGRFRSWHSSNFKNRQTSLIKITNTCLHLYTVWIIISIIRSLKI